MSEKEAILRFLRIEGETLTIEELEKQITSIKSDTHPDMGDFQDITGTFGNFWITSRGNVISYSLREISSHLEPLSPDEASKSAREFILRHQPDFARRNFVSIEEEVEESIWKGEWQEKPLPDEFSIYRNLVRVEVHMWKHSITDYFRTDLRFIRKTPPKISEAEARKKVLEEFKDGYINEIYLMEKPVEGGKRSITVWFVGVETVVNSGPEPEDNITKLDHRLINADTGELVPRYPEE